MRYMKKIKMNGIFEAISIFLFSNYMHVQAIKMIFRNSPSITKRNLIFLMARQIMNLSFLKV